MHGLCVIGLLAATFMKVSADELQVGVAAPSGILCFPLDGPATFDCNATVAAEQDPKIALKSFYLKNKNQTTTINCFPSFQTETAFNYSWIGPVKALWREQPLLNTLNCTFNVASIRDLDVACAATTESKYTETSFSILTTKIPEQFGISTGGQQDTSIIEIEEGTNATISCTAVNSKPGLNLSWNPKIGFELDSSSISDDRGITNTSISSLVIGSRDLHKTNLTCTGLALPCITDSAAMTASAVFEIIYGPDNVIKDTEQDRFNVTITCPLISNPPIATYDWSQDGSSLDCIGKACHLSANGSRTTITCVGSNPRSSTRATAIIVITWKDSGNPNPGNPDKLSDGAIAGIIVSILIVVAVVIIVPIIYIKKKRSKRNIGSTGHLGGSSKTDVSTGQLYDRPYNDQRQAAIGSKGADEQRKSNIGASYYSNDNNVDNVPRSRNPIAMQDVSLDDLVQNPLYS